MLTTDENIMVGSGQAEKISLMENCHFGVSVAELEKMGFSFKFEGDKPTSLYLPSGWRSEEGAFWRLIYNDIGECQCMIIRPGDLTPQAIFRG